MQYYGVSDMGKKRTENQDRIYIPKAGSEIKLFIVADGMGGANAGSVASTTAIEFVKDYIFNHCGEISLGREGIEQLVQKAMYETNNFVYSKSKKTNEYAGMGTTLIVAIVHKNKVYIGHIGDSRVYRIRKNIIRQLTKDHSYVQALLQSGSITKEEAENHPQKNVLLKVLGCEKNIGADVLTKGFLKEDVLVICSDGLTNMIGADEIYNIVMANKGKIETACKELVNEANLRGGYDNISAVLISND